MISGTGSNVCLPGLSITGSFRLTKSLGARAASVAGSMIVNRLDMNYLGVLDVWTADLGSYWLEVRLCAILFVANL